MFKFYTVETTNNPEEAASTMAMQKASVKDVFKKISLVFILFID
jgi:hypothetical protein